MGAVILTKETFQEEIQKGLTLVDFWAPWCGPCKIQLPIIEELTEEVKGKAAISKVNVDEEPELAAQYGVQSIPTLILFEDGKLLEKMVGVQSKGHEYRFKRRNFRYDFSRIRIYSKSSSDA
jgi:thioredoxin 1